MSGNNPGAIPTAKGDNIFLMILTLVIIAAVSAGVLAAVDFITQKPRLQALLKQTNDALKMMDPKLDNNPDQQKITIQGADNRQVVFFPAENNGQLTSVIGQTVSPFGYGGNMTVLADLNQEGVINNVMVTANNETPGLGTNVVDRVLQKTLVGIIKGEYDHLKGLPPNKFLDQFDGDQFVPDKAAAKTPKQLPPDMWKVKKDGGAIDEVTGATISSRAVTYGVKIIAQTYCEKKKDILDKFKQEGAKLDAKDGNDGDAGKGGGK